jgi:hypothetical protein
MRKSYPQFAVVILSILTVNPVSSDAFSVQESLVEKIRSGQHTLSHAEQDLAALKRRGALDTRQILDYEAWIQQLHFGLQQDCRQLYRTAIVALPPDLPCDTGGASGTAAADIDTVGERSREEAIVDLDDHLSRSLGEFDEKLLREQERVKAGRPATSSDTAAAVGAGSGSGDAEGEVEGEAGREGQQAASEQQAASNEQADSADAGTGKPGRPDRSSAPPGTPDGSDDDVVARQLREAAEAEKDPELKRKLWEEYRKYKQGIQ